MRINVKKNQKYFCQDVFGFGNFERKFEGKKIERKSEMKDKIWKNKKETQNQ